MVSSAEGVDLPVPRLQGVPARFSGASVCRWPSRRTAEIRFQGVTQRLPSVTMNAGKDLDGNPQWRVDRVKCFIDGGFSSDDFLVELKYPEIF